MDGVAAVGLVLGYIVIGHGLEEWKERSWGLSRYFAELTFHESVPAVLLGAGLSAVSGAHQGLFLDKTAFFDFVLPFIILHQGYSLKKKNFFRQFHYIVLLGVFGTLLCFLVTTGAAYLASRLPSRLSILRQDGVPLRLCANECMLLAAVLSACDEVASMALISEKRHPKLAAILFGEGVVNDAVSILLFHAVAGVDSGIKKSVIRRSDSIADDDYAAVEAVGWSLDLLLSFGEWIVGLLVAAVGIGCGVALLVSLLLRFTPSMRKFAVRQAAVVLLGGYLSFALSEAVGASGILTVFFCGITMSHYGFHSLSERAKVSTSVTFGTLSAISEAYCFTALGLSLHEWSDILRAAAFAAFLLLVMTATRYLYVRLLCRALGEAAARDGGRGDELILWVGGLVRGAVAFAQVLKVTGEHADVLRAITMTVVLATTIGFGVIMPFIVKVAAKGEGAADAARVRSYGATESKEAAPLLAHSMSERELQAILDAAEAAAGDQSAGQAEEQEALAPFAWRWWSYVDDRFMKKAFGGRRRRHGAQSPLLRIKIVREERPGREGEGAEDGGYGGEGGAASDI